MKKILILAATTALIAGGCGGKDDAKTEAKAEEAKVEMTEAATDTAEKMDTKAEEAYGSGTEGSAEGMSAEDREVMMAGCTSEGGTEEACGCVIDAMEETLSPGTLQMMIDGSRAEANGNEEAAAEIMSNMTEEQGVEMMGLMPIMMECDPEMMDRALNGQ